MLANPNVERSLRHIAALAVFVALGAGLFSAASPARADDTTGISGAPSDGTSTDDRSRFSYQVDPGQHVDDSYLVRNTGSTAQTMKILATDAFDTAQGAFSLLDTKQAPVDGGSWVTFANGQHSIDLPIAAGETKVVSFRLDVPSNAAPGDHAGGIVISVATAQGSIMVDRRVATRMYVRVKGALQPALTVGNISADYAGSLNPFNGTTDVKFTVRNNGNVALGADMVVNVKTYLGIGASGLVRTSVSELLPGSTRVVTVAVPGVPQLGYLNPHVNLVPTVDKDALNPGPLRTIERDSTLFVMPWWVLILLVVAGLVVLIVRLRRRSDRIRATAWIEHTESEARRKAAEAIEDQLITTGVNNDAS
ncbi:WxL protein peptidoglycan domain-containing protein [Lacisediminihabitans changchengi]|uniref:DUF916 domain-containing protein n=1 Tax=Lacisediminihabitans changchengi TaxID=2787634 RepID=A0A934STA7_9MICO|nr:DUF916 domain-containing protein [Lacisediminihabitans changchengi]MBK4348608.1 DUF916 domain-containing protein [Lacisediminihabitans changchengi]